MKKLNSVLAAIVLGALLLIARSLPAHAAEIRVVEHNVKELVITIEGRFYNETDKQLEAVLKATVSRYPYSRLLLVLDSPGGTTTAGLGMATL